MNEIQQLDLQREVPFRQRYMIKGSLRWERAWSDLFQISLVKHQQDVWAGTRFICVVCSFSLRLWESSHHFKQGSFISFEWERWLQWHEETWNSWSERRWSPELRWQQKGMERLKRQRKVKRKELVRNFKFVEWGGLGRGKSLAYIFLAWVTEGQVVPLTQTG